LLALLELPKEMSERRWRTLRRAIGPDSPGKMNQGNPEIAHHSISKAKCLAGLQGVVLQTEQQRKICGGRKYMVPIYRDGKPESVKACIDIFEFPNKPCELPFVWASAAQSRAVCRALGKRLCSQEEWMVACEADPAGGKAWRYGYGAELDLKICHTNRSNKKFTTGQCNPRTVRTTWKTCRTNTEPAGSFPQCRSRLGVFDLHGNVAEAMKRPDRGKTYSQLKGSAFFYVDVHRKFGRPPKKATYPDHCRYDPRWHVQELKKAWHVNYHLGFRCCLTVPRKAGSP